MPECAQTPGVGRYSMVSEITAHHLTQPSSLLMKRSMQTAPQSFFNGSQSRAHSISPRFAVENELSRTRMPTNVGKAEKVECFRFVKTAFCSTLRRETAELKQTSLLRM